MIAVDTHEEVQELKAAGFTGAQAEAVTRIVRKAQDIDLSSLAAKNDLPVTKADLQRDLANTKVEMLKRRVIGAIGIQMIVIFGAVIALTRTIPH